MAFDPVCRMDVDEEQAVGQGLTSQYQGRTYYFCGTACKAAFDQEPGRYAERAA